MIKLSREIRFALPPRDRLTSRNQANTWAGWPSSDLLVPHLILRCVLSGKPDRTTGYLCNIKVVDDFLQELIIDHLIANNNCDPDRTTVAIFTAIAGDAFDRWPATPAASGTIESLELAISPFVSYTLNRETPNMVLVTQQFEFSAAHRLHCPQLSEAENRDVFGKCNHPSGHGHNYVVEVTVAPEAQSHSLAQLETTVKRVVIDRLDHTHLNEDIDYFRQINPSVENIAQAIFDWLEPELMPQRLKRVRVYETPKTWAECDSRG